MIADGGCGFRYKDIDLGAKRYRLFIQEISIVSPEGRTVGLFVRPASPFGSPLSSRLEQAGESEEDMWDWAEARARSHAGQLGE